METPLDPDPEQAEPPRGPHLSRRSILGAGLAGGALASMAPTLGLVASGAAGIDVGGGDAEADPAADDPVLDLADIQGNVLGGFNKDHQRLLFVRFGDPAQARAWLGVVVDEVATSEEVLAFNTLFSAARARRSGEQTTPTAQWMNVALTYAGLDAALDVPSGDLSSFPEDFRHGMVARAALLGDVDASAPDRWVGLAGADDVHGLLILAADRSDDLDELAADHEARLGSAGITVVFDQSGETRADQPGHEHFGFRDGISQPGIRGLTERQNPNDPGQGIPGQDLLWPGEFIVGQPTQIRTSDPENDEGGNEAAGPVSTAGPAWTANGSFLVFRRLRQDVDGFHRFLAETAAAQGISDEQMGAKLVGRYPSGAPLAHLEDQPEDLDTTAGDPSVDDPSVLDDSRINAFEFAEDDEEGLVVPRSAHVRKVYPRDTTTPTGREADTQTHRLLRRGLPFGASYDPAAAPGSAAGADAAYPQDRGLLFLAYQTSIERQFEFVQSRWVNEADAPGAGGGEDPIISPASATRTFALPGGQPDHVEMMERFVITTAGAYLFQPSVSALQQLASGLPPVVGPPPPSGPDGQDRGGGGQGGGGGHPHHPGPGGRPRR